MSSTTFLLAPDSFKGTLSAQQVAEALAEGVSSVGVQPDVCPVADGGEGTMRVLLESHGGELRKCRVSDPLGGTTVARYAVLNDGSAVIEAAEASGVRLVTPSPDAAEQASTYGTGELIVRAARMGCRSIFVAAGGSATTDGGAGAIAAIQRVGGVGSARLTVLCDVRSPFQEAANLFGPQKGADEKTVKRLTRRLLVLAESLPHDPRNVPMSGAAGGLAGGLWAAFGARLVPGAETVFARLGVGPRIAQAAAVVTGEGRLDAQSLDGKVVGEMARRCRLARTPLYVVVGESRLPVEQVSAADFATVLEAGDLEEIRVAGAHVASGRRPSLLRAGETPGLLRQLSGVVSGTPS